MHTTDENGEYTVPVKYMLCSSGVRYNKLPNGIYKMKDRHRWLTMLIGDLFGQYSTRITGSFHFHSITYTRERSNRMVMDAYENLGEQASDGCVRLLCRDAKWIYDNCPQGTPIIVTDGEEYIEFRDLAEYPEIVEGNKGWDPTDDNPDNPFYVPIPPDATPAPTPYPYATVKPNQFKFSKDVPRTTPRT